MPQAANCSFCCSTVHSSMTRLCPGNRRFFLFIACAHAAQAVTFCCSTKSNQKGNQGGQAQRTSRKCLSPLEPPSHHHAFCGRSLWLMRTETLHFAPRWPLRRFLPEYVKTCEKQTISSHRLATRKCTNCPVFYMGEGENPARKPTKRFDKCPMLIYNKNNYEQLRANGGFCAAGTERNVRTVQ